MILKSKCLVTLIKVHLPFIFHNQKNLTENSAAKRLLITKYLMKKISYAC